MSLLNSPDPAVRAAVDGPQMLRGETRTFARKLAQPFGMNAFGASRIDGDRGEYAALLHQARKGAMTGSARAQASRLIEAPSFVVKRASSAFACAGSKPRVS